GRCASTTPSSGSRRPSSRCSNSSSRNPGSSSPTSTCCARSGAAATGPRATTCACTSGSCAASSVTTPAIPASSSPSPASHTAGSAPTDFRESRAPYPEPVKAVGIVPHTHWDREWYAPFQRYRVQLVRLVDDLLDLLESDPSFTRFLLDGQTAVVDD